MNITVSKISGAYIIEPKFHFDERGFFAELMNAKTMNNLDMDTTMAQWNLAYNERKGTLRGLHYQEEPHGENKIIRCVKGGIFDVLVDLRKDSKSYLKVVTTVLNQHKTLYVPKGVAHGYQTLMDGTTVFYQTSAPYHPESARTIRHNSFKIGWPLGIIRISKKDDEAPKWKK